MQIKKTTLYQIFGIIVVMSLLVIAYMFFSSNQTGTSNSNQDSSQFSTVNAQQFDEQVSEDNAVLLDVRTAEEYSLGRIPGAINIDYYSNDFQAQIAELDREGNYKIYCNSGNRSSSALELMKSLGFTNVTELAGGIQSWAGQGYEVCTNC